MLKRKEIILFTVLIGLYAAIALHGRVDRAALKRVGEGANAAESSLAPRALSSRDLEALASGLRAINSSGVPDDVKVALSKYVAAVDRHAASVRETGFWGTNTAWEIGTRQKELRTSLTKKRFRLF
jgi:hypothetical protein